MYEEHNPVMLEEFLSFFKEKTINVFFDGTLGAGGHARALLEAHPEIRRYIACDRDPAALQIARKYLEPWKEKIDFVQGNFSDLDQHLAERRLLSVDGFFLISECRLCN
jgi:16S rRNA (cytosine1402-N4)-methyltransferase